MVANAGDTALTPDQRRRLIAKRFNEHMRLIATVFNTAAAASTVGIVIVPAIAPSSTNAPVHVEWLLAAIILHVVGQTAISFLKSEE